MAEALKRFFSPALVRRLAREVAAVHPEFPAPRFVRAASAGLGELELVARALRAHLPPRYADAVRVLVRSLGPELASEELEGPGMAPFFYLPHSLFVAEYGLEDFDVSMAAQHEITRRFSCELSIRPFLEARPDETLAVLRRWAREPSPHVRRLVSEGTRPRLPWATRVRWIEREPERVLPLLESTKDDPASAVRRSVANHLNDLSKARPELARAIARRWLRGASPQRAQLVAHALRSLVKRGDRGALWLLGFGARPQVEIQRVAFSPARPRIGGATRVDFALRATGARTQRLVVDLVVHFVKRRGKTSAKVFKVGRAELAPRATLELGKRVSLAVHTTRTPYAGRHRVEALINGATFPLGAFELRA